MDEFREHIEDEQLIIERIVEYIPGYRSYRQRERRREVDKALRTYITSQLREFMTRLRNLSKPLTNAGKIDVLDDIDNVYRRLEAVADKVMLASYGYSGFFDAVKIRDKELEALYQFDRKLLEAANALKALLEPEEEQTLVTDSVRLNEKLKEIQTAVRNLESLIIERTNLIINVKGL